MDKIIGAISPLEINTIHIHFFCFVLLKAGAENKIAKLIEVYPGASIPVINDLGTQQSISTCAV